MSIKELAQEHGITPAAIRHYERYGLLDERHVTRGPNGYRRFTPLASRRLALIKIGQLVGFSLNDMTSTLRHWDDGEMSVDAKKHALRAQLAQVHRRIDELHSVESLIQEEIAKAC